jgi:hypothetical protein
LTIGVLHGFNCHDFGSSGINPLGDTLITKYDKFMTLLEKALSKTALERLDAFRKARGIRTRREALEVALDELTEDIPTPSEIKMIQQGLKAIAQGKTTPGSEVHQAIRNQTNLLSIKNTSSRT